MALTKISTGMLKQDAASSDLNIDAGTLYIDVSNNRVGIANTSPSQALNITGNALATGWLRGAGGSATTPTFLVDGSTGMFRASGNDIGFSTAGSERMRIDSSGGVGINRTSIASSYKLHVGGDIAIGAGGAYGQITPVESGTTGLRISGNGSGTLRLASGGVDAMYVIDGGNVGIGTSSPNNKLEISGGNIRIINHSTGRITFNNGSTEAFFGFNGAGSSTLDSGALPLQVQTQGSNHIRFDTNSTERMRIDSSGNVGIGTTTPTEPLTVSETSSGNLMQVASFVNPVGTANTGVRLWLSGTNTTTRGTFIDAVAESTANNHSLRFGTSASSAAPTERMRIDSSGNVGIGTSSPTAKLHLSSTVGAPIYIQDSNATSTFNITELSNNGGNFGIQTRNSSGTFVSTDYQIVKDANGAQYQRWFTAGTERMRIDSSGNVGIGTTSPSYKLVIADSNGAGLEIIPQTSNDRTTLLSYDRNASTYQSLDLDGSDLQFNIAGTERMRVESNGNVGIGTTGPTASLHVNGANQTGGTARFQPDSAKGTQISHIHYGTTGDWYIRAASTSGKVIINDNGGNVGIGTTSPSYKLDVNGTIRAQGAITSTLTSSGGTFLSIGHTGNENWSFDAKSGSGSTDYVDFGIAGSTRCMTWQEDGNVGIGTSNPSRNLSIVKSGGAALQVADSAQGEGSNDGFLIVQSGVNTSLEGRENGYMNFLTNATERLRIASGNPYIFLGDTGHSWTTFHAVAQIGRTGAVATYDSGANQQTIVANNTYYGSGGYTSIEGTSAASYMNANQGHISFFTAPTIAAGSAQTFTQRFKIHRDGNIGIGTDGPSAKLHLATTGSEEIGIGLSNSQRYYGIQTTGGDLTIKDVSAGGTERMRIDSSGSVLVGTTVNDGQSIGSGSQNGIVLAGESQYIQRGDNANLWLSKPSGAVNSEFIKFYNNGSMVGNIGVDGSSITIGDGSSVGLKFVQSGPKILPRGVDGTVQDGLIDLGDGNDRFDDIYATNGTIQTSDRNEKQDIEALSDAEQRVAVAAKGLLRKFRWIDAVEAKGDDARIHFGIIAQDLQDAFTAEGLDAGRYAMFINSTWTDEETGEERSRMGVRYSELLAFIISAI